jgi:hypothetical protein
MKRIFEFGRICPCLALAIVFGTPDAQARDPAGQVTFAEGEAWVQVGVARNPLETGSIVYTGDQVRTGDESNLYIRFRDDTFFALGPEAGMTIDRFDEREEAETSFAASVLKGAFRFVSGLLGRKAPEKFKVQVTVGTIGIRGTNVAGEVFERRDTDSGVVEASASVMLLEDEEGRDTAIEVSNQYGSVVVEEPGYGTEIPDEHSPPSPVRRMQIRTVDNLMRAIRNTTRGSMRRRP